ncbi:MAG TPA: GNAT family N-acetyltransferase [Opitutaceae bacterium]|nr:GNAT family N-acetyltransferase [Opitutaceae bacterium]
MTAQVIIADREQHAPQIRELFWEYLQWANARANEEFKVGFDSATMLEGNMKDLGKFMPPGGRLLLCSIENDLAGIACLKQLTPSIGEIKRMYVPHGHRKEGLGRTLIDRLLQEAQQIGYQLVRLDSARFMKEAHQLYRSIGFKEIAAYAGSEIPKEFQVHWVFMEIPLQPPKP